MSDSKGEGFTLPWPTIMTLLVITGGVWLSVDELTSSRPPPGTPLPTPETHGYFDVDARLWQDPLAAAFERREAVLRAAAARVMQSPARQKPSNHSRPIDGHSVAALKHEISSAVARAGELTRVNRIKVPSAAAAPVLILPVMIKGGPYPENAESRLRSRQAILSGLTVGGFVPRDGEHLAYFEVAWPERVEPD